MNRWTPGVPLRLVLIFTGVLMTLVWLPLLRGPMDGPSYEWGWPFGVGGAGVGGDYWVVVLWGALGLAALWLGWRGARRPVHVLLPLWHLPLAGAGAWMWWMNPDLLRFRGDTLGIDVPLGGGVAALLVGVLLLALIWGIRDWGPARGRALVPLTPAGRRILLAAGLLLPLQFVLLRFGEPHGTTDAVGVWLILGQWTAVNVGLALQGGRAADRKEGGFRTSLRGRPGWTRAGVAMGVVVASSGLIWSLAGGPGGGAAGAADDRTGPGDPPLVLLGRVIDGTGAAPIERGEVVIEGERVRCVGARGECRRPAGAQVLEVGSGTILPGLIELHVHARDHYLSFFLPAGITSIRDANNSLSDIVALLEVGPYRPRVFWSGPMLDGDRTVMRFSGDEGVMGPDADNVEEAWTLEVATPEAVRAAVDLLADRGASHVKLYEQLLPEVFTAAVERATDRGLRTMTDLGMHTTRGLTGAEIDALQAAAWGVNSIEHASGFALAYQRLGGDPHTLPLDAELINAMAVRVVATGAAVVPTLSVFNFARRNEVPDLSALPQSERVSIELWNWWVQSQSGRTPEQRRNSELGMELARDVAVRVAELGGVVGAGSDTPAGVFNPPGGGLHLELELLVDAGLTPLQAIHAATGAAAAILGNDELGVLERGRLADVIIVEGDPSRDIRETRRIRHVIQGGRLLPMDELYQMMPPVREG